LNAREAVERLYAAKVDGKTALQIRRAVRKMQEPLQDYEAALKAWVESEGITDGATFGDLEPEQREHWNEMLTAEVEQTWTAALSDEDLDSVELSASELDALISVGLIDDGEAESEPEAEPA
jgi:hypothetical protein